MSATSIILEVMNTHLWCAHYPKMEMQTNCTYAHLKPALAFRVSGLVLDKNYTVSLSLRLWDKKKYQYLAGKWKWQSTEDELPNASRVVQHGFGIKNGEHWMKRAFSFGDIKICNRAQFVSGNTIQLEMGYKYVPVIRIQEVDKPDNVIEFKVRVAQFYAVTRFKNPEIALWKKDIPHKFYERVMIKQEKQDDDKIGIQDEGLKFFIS